MAKRVRGTTSRPGQRPPLQRSARSAKPSGAVAKPTTAAASAAGVVAPPPDSLTDAEEARAAELEAAILAEERQADDSRRRFRASRSTEPVATPRATSSIQAAAAEEYAYVARDVRRIAIVGGGLVALLLILWVIAMITGFRL